MDLQLRLKKFKAACSIASKTDASWYARGAWCNGKGYLACNNTALLWVPQDDSQASFADIGDTDAFKLLVADKETEAALAIGVEPAAAEGKLPSLVAAITKVETQTYLLRRGVNIDDLIDTLNGLKRAGSKFASLELVNNDAPMVLRSPQACAILSPVKWEAIHTVKAEENFMGA